MKALHIDCSMGAAGDMLTAALLDLLPPSEREGFVRGFGSLGIPGVTMETEPSVKCGVRGIRVIIRISGEEEGIHAHDHSGSGHSHHSMADIRDTVFSLKDLSEKIKRDVMDVYSVIADAESKAHGVPVTEVHFHEVGMMDAIADITAVCMLMDRIGADRITASAVNVGGGTVRCAHGIIPVPAPATAIILEGIPSYSGDIKSELCTPTGAALLRHFVSSFGDMPPMTVMAEGYGMGKKNFDRANCVKISLGETD